MGIEYPKCQFDNPSDSFFCNQCETKNCLSDPRVKAILKKIDLEE